MAWPVDPDTQPPLWGMGPLAGPRRAGDVGQSGMRQPAIDVPMSGRWPGTKPGLPQDGRGISPAPRKRSLPNTELTQTRPPSAETGEAGHLRDGLPTSHASSSREGTHQDKGPKAKGEAIWQPKITATCLLGSRKGEFAFPRVGGQRTGLARHPHPAQATSGRIFVKGLVHKWKPASGSLAGLLPRPGGWRAQNFPVQEAAGGASIHTPGRRHMVCDDEAHGEEPAGQSREAPGPRRSGPARVTGQRERRGGGGPPTRRRVGQGAVSKVAMLVCSRPRSSHRVGVCEASCLEQRE